MLTHIHPSRLRFTCRTSSRIKGVGYPSSESGPTPGTAKCPEPLCPLWALPAAARCLASRQRALPLLHRSYGLMRQTKILLTAFGFALYGRSLQVAVSPCWKLALPDVISTICVKALGPVPRRVPNDPVRLDALALGLDALIERTSASPQSRRTRHAKKFPCNATSTGRVFRGCSHSLMFRLPYSLGPPVAPTAATNTEQPGRLHHAMNMGLPALISQGFP